jgi:serine protease AprX
MIKLRTLIVAVILLAFFKNSTAQVSPKHYLVNLTDKKHSSYSIDKPNEFLSERALARRAKAGIEITENDIPVSKFYLDSLKSLGLKIINISKWMNSVSVFSTDTALLDTLDRLSFVRSMGIDKVESSTLEMNLTKKPPVKPHGVEEADSTYFLKYGNSFKQIKVHNGHLMHNEGYYGQGMQIAILDAGFYKVDELPAFERLRENNQILGVRDFVDGDKQVYDADSHGMKVLSTMAGFIPGELLGTAPKASYWLLRSEQAATEYIIEEHNWVVAAEFADSVGADIINSSLGYSDFDDPSTSHTYTDLDGNTTMITRAADIAASKGMLVVTSAGNEGFSQWKYISAPADADSILSIGAIMPDGRRAYFSSYGPTSDQRIKPDVCAIGLPSIVSGTNGFASSSSGTSFSSPIMAGLVACLWQAHPELTNMDIIDVIKRSASQFSAPDTSLGYGIPDIYAAHLYLKTSGAIDVKKQGSMRVFPNPFKTKLHIEFLSQQINIPYNMRIEMFDLKGQKVIDDFQPEIKNNFKITTYEQFKDLSSGLYLLRLTADNLVLQKKVMKY